MPNGRRSYTDVEFGGKHKGATHNNGKWQSSSPHPKPIVQLRKCPEKCVCVVWIAHNNHMVCMQAKQIIVFGAERHPSMPTFH